jgi:transposase InsO family protein
VHRVHVQGTIATKKRGRPAQGPLDYKERYEILKKYKAFLKEVDRGKKIAFITRERHHHRLSVLCDVLEIAPSNYYKYLHQLDPDLPMYRLIRHWQKKRVYLSKNHDLQSRNIVTLVISHRNDIKLGIDTLYQALDKKKDPNGLILHSD